MTTPDTLSHLGHELRTPLNHIIGFSEMLLEEAEDAGGSDLVPALKVLKAQAAELLGQMNLLLAAAANEADYAPARLAAELRPSLQGIVASVDRLQEGVWPGTERLRGDVGRITAAARRLVALLMPEEAPPVPAAPPASAKPQTPMAKGTILVADDNEGNREVLTRRLSRQGFDVVTAENGRRALEILRVGGIDLVLLDVMMPEMDGYETLKQVKSSDALRHIPVLMVSALDEMESVIRCIELGAEDYLPVPFNPVLLQARIGASLEKKRLRDQEVRHLRELAEWNRTLEKRVADQVAQVERLSRLKRFFSPKLAELMVSGGAVDPLKTHRREITVVFLDLRGFTSFAEIADPDAVMGMLRDYHSAMGRLVMSHEGTLERFTGDGMMVFFNDPVPVDNPAEQAVRMAVAMRDEAEKLKAGWTKQGFDLGLGIGLAEGDATIGAIGFEGRWDYGAIGTVTNLAARLCAEAKGGQILATRRILAATSGIVDVEPVGDLLLKGLHLPVPTFNIVGLAG
ncbi:MAG TPA: response regulator [Stellaceae bacterium]|nr:response regulator [Stellaceae bacterium]